MNNTGVPVIGPVRIALDNLTGGVLANGAGVTANNAPLGSKYVTVTTGNIAAGGSASVTLLFNNPPTGAITYTPRAITGSLNP